MKTKLFQRWIGGLALLATLGVFSSLHGGEPAKGGRSCRILFVKRPPASSGRVLMRAGEKVQKIEVPGLSLSTRYPLPGGDLLLHFTTEAAEPAEAAEAAEPAEAAEEAEEAGPGSVDEESSKPPAVEIPASWRRVFIVLEGTSPGSDLPFTVHAFDASPENLKPGEMLWVNLTDVEVSGEIGERTLELPPQSQARLKAPASGNDDYLVDLRMLAAGETRPLPLIRSKWRPEAKGRMLVLVVAEEGRRAPRVMAVPDRDTPK